MAWAMQLHESRSVMRAHLTVIAASLLAVVAVGCIAEASPSPPARMQTLRTSDTSADDQLGRSIAIDGDLLVVGAPLHDSSGVTTGAAYVFRLDRDRWILDARLIPSDAELGARFGWSVDISSSRVIVGAPHTLGSSAGTAYVFRRTDGDWVEEARLSALDPQSGDSFGHAVAIDHAHAVVGAPSDSRDGMRHVGSAWAFVLDRRAWVNDGRLVSRSEEAGDQLGWAVDVHGSVAVVGAPRGMAQRPGSAYVYRRIRGHWFRDTEHHGGARHPDGFGSGVALDGWLLAVSAPGERSVLAQTHVEGAVHGYWDDGFAYRRAVVLVPGDPRMAFGASISVDGGLLAVHAPDVSRAAEIGDTMLTFRDQGHAQWDAYMSLSMPAGHRFAESVATDGVRLAAGMPGDGRRGPDSGAARVYW